MLQRFLLLFNMLTSKQKTKMVILQVFFFLSAVMQVAGVASLAPFIAVISNSSVIETNLVLNYLYEFLNADSLKMFLLQYAVLVAGFIFIGNIIAAFVLWLLFHFSINTGAALQNQLYTNYMANEYIFFANKNSSTLIANITSQIPRLVYMVLQPILSLISQFFIVVIIIGGLIYLDPMLAFSSALIIFGIYSLIYIFLRKEMVVSGATITEVMERKLVLLNESIQGIKEVKLLNVEKWYQQELNATTMKGLNAQAFVGLSGDLPKFIVETIVFTAILGLAIYLIFTQGVEGSAMSTLSFYAMAGYKLLPAAQTIYKAISSIKANAGVISDIHKELENSKQYLQRNLIEDKSYVEKESEQLNSRHFDIKLNNVDFQYPTSETSVISDLNLQIPENTMVSFVGGSGAGKSTVANLILGLLTPTEGNIEVGGELLTKANLRAWQKGIGYVPQSIFLTDDTLAKNIAFGIPDDEIDEQRLIAAATKANIIKFIEQQPNKFQFKVGENGGRLSGGQRQRVGIARALYKNPRILVLDEATSALDGITEKLILNEIHQLTSSLTVIMIAHRLSTIVNSDVIYLISAGTVAAEGSYKQLIKENEYFRKLVESSKNEER
ncbi:MAG: ABC-type multidrug transport system fused ATPase/permease subunit [Oceanospirillaceae bacterium]|jgi:ABC-type multidrug transport system fused ATPase/permease subunit